LDIGDGIESEPAWYAGLHKLDDASNYGLGIVCLDKIKVAFGFGFAEILRLTLVRAVATRRCSRITNPNI